MKGSEKCIDNCLGLHCEAQRSAENAYRPPEAAVAADIRSVFQRGVEKAERSSTGQLSIHAHRVNKIPAP